MGKRHPNYRLVKIHRNYSVEEIARMCGKHKNTVRAWLKDGLEMIDKSRPRLVHGNDLAAFLKGRRTAGKRPSPPGHLYCFKSRLNYSDADYFSLSLKDTAIAKAANEERIPTLDQIRHVIEAMPCGTDIEKRNRALIAFILLTGVRDNAVASMRLKHVDLADGKILQDARQVRTKFSKSSKTFFSPLARKFLPFSPNGWRFCKRSGFGGSTIRSFRRRASRLV
jgi:integrase